MSKTRKAKVAEDHFAFPGKTDENLPLLASISKKLQHPPKSKDTLLKTLKQLSSTLEAGPQETSSLGDQGEPIANSLLDSAILGHADKDVKLSVAYCIVQLLRIYAPETPYGDEQLRDIFKLLCWVFQRLAQPSAPTFEICQSILQQTEQVKLYMLLLDLNDPQLTTQLFESLLGAARADNLEAIELSALEMLAGLVEELEADTLGQELLEVLLKALLGIGYNPAAQKLVQRLLQRCEEQLHSSLQRFTTALLTGTTSSSLRPECMRVIRQLYQCTPQVLLPVLPHLHAELEALDAAQRLAATELLVTLLCMPESDIPEHFPKLAGATLQRYKDVCPNIRVHMLEHTPQLATFTKNASIREQALNMATDRLQDPEERVRLAALQTLAGIATSHSLHGISHRTFDGLFARLRDAKLAVRREAATAMASMFRSLAGDVARVGGLSDAVDTMVLNIPGRLSGAAVQDFELRPHIHALLYQQGLLPPSTPAPTAAKIWALVWADAEPKDRDQVLRLLRSKTELQRAMAALLVLRQKLKAKAYADEGEQAALMRRHQRACSAILDELIGSQAAAADSRAKTYPLLNQLLEVKDGRVFDRLATVCNPLADEREARDARRDAIERVGTKSPLGAFLSNLTATLAPSLLPPSTLAALVQLGCPLPEQSQGAAGSEPPQPPPRKKQRQITGGDVKQSKQARSPAAPPVSSNSKGATSSSMGATATSAMLASAARVLVGGAAKAAPALCTGLVGHAAQVVMLWVPPEGIELQPEPSIEQQQQQQQQQQRVQTTGPSRRGRGGRGGRHGAAAAPPAGNSQEQQQQLPQQEGGAGLQGEQLHGGFGSTEHPGAPPASPPPSLGALAAAVKVIANTMRAYIDALKERQGIGSLPALPHGLAPVLRALCVHSTPKVAKLAAFALAGVAEAQAVAPSSISTPNGTHTADRAAHRGASAAQQQGGHGSGKEGYLAAQEALQDLAEHLASILQQAAAVQGQAVQGGKQRGGSKGGLGAQQGKGVGTLHALCALQALGSVGCIAPQVFAGYVRDTAHYVNHVLLSAPIDQATASAALLPMELHAGGPSEPLPAEVDEEGESVVTWGQFSAIASAKARALKALVRGCTPRVEAATHISPDTALVAEALFTVFENLMDVDNDMQALPPSSPMDIALMRLMAGKGTLRLALRHDTRMPNSTYCMLSLVMQDPVLEVRSEFAKALLQHVTVLMAQGMRTHTQQSGMPTLSAGGWMPSKYAAMLPLAAVDPHEPNRARAARALVDYVIAKRRAARAAAQQAALITTTSATSRGAAAPQGTAGAERQQQVQELPEFMLPYLVYLLAHHPDFPEQVALDAVASGGLAAAPPALGGTSTHQQLHDKKPGRPQVQQQQQQNKQRRAHSFQSNGHSHQSGSLSLSQEGGGAGRQQPGREEGEEEGKEQPVQQQEEQQAALQPFSQMLQALLEPLLLEGHGRAGAGPGPGADAALLLPVVQAILQANKLVEIEAIDAEDPHATTRMRSLCDLGLLLGRSIVERELHGRPGPSHVPAYPGQIMLPKALFSFAHLSRGPKPKLHWGDHLPPGFIPFLDEGASTAANPFGATAKAEGGRRKGAAQARKQGAGRRGRGGAAMKKMKQKSEGSGGEDSKSDTEGTTDSHRPPSHTKASPKKGRARAQKVSTTAGPALKKAKQEPTRQMPSRAGKPKNMAVDREEREHEDGGTL